MPEQSSASIPVSIIIVGYGGEGCILDCLDSIFTSVDNDPFVDLRVLLVDNHSPDQMAKRVEGNFADQIASGRLKILATDKNRGFAGGNNFGWNAIQRLWPETRYLCLLNQDTIVTPGWLGTIVEYMDHHPNVGAAQPKIMLHADPVRINSAGNISHFLGFGFCAGDRQVDSAQFDGVHEVNYCSGAAVVIRAEPLYTLGLFEDEFFMYLEDADLGWKLKQVGLLNVVVTASRIYHKHTYTSTLSAYYWLEKNRLWLLAVYYKWQTLLLLSPAFVTMEIGQFLFAISRGMVFEKIRSWDDFLRKENLDRLFRTRKFTQARRTINDAAFMSGFRGTFESPGVKSWALTYLGNPILAAYWGVARHLIFW